MITNSLVSQNLIPNGSFEELECPNNPINSINTTATWYAVGADAYWLHVRCPFDEVASQSVIALNASIVPSRGLGYMSLEAAVTENGFFVSEGVGIELSETLKPDRFYYFGMALMNYDLFEGPGYSGINCDPLPEQNIDLYVTNETLIFNASYNRDQAIPYLTKVELNGEQRLTTNIASQSDFRNYQWYQYWDCFQANGGERHLGVAGNNYKIETGNSCFIEGQPNPLYLSGYGVDELQLVELPIKLDTLIALCDGGVNVNLHDLVKDPFFDKATYFWNDGFSGTERFITAAGNYEIEMKLPCTIIPITISVDEELCATNIYVPNTFSPNNDGINDELKPFIKTQLGIIDYKFQVFDRWGGLVFQTTNPSEGWRGGNPNNLLEQGVFLWKLVYVLDNGANKKVVKTGSTFLFK